VSFSASSSVSSWSKASINASSIISSFTTSLSFSRWNSAMIFCVSARFICWLAVFSVSVIVPKADAAATVDAIVVACIAMAPIWDFVDISFSLCCFTVTICLAKAFSAGSLGELIALARCFSSIINCFS